MSSYNFFRILEKILNIYKTYRFAEDFSLNYYGEGAASAKIIKALLKTYK